MEEEELIKFETAKSAKEKGFNEWCLSYFSFFSFGGRKHKWIEEIDNLRRNYNKPVHDYDKHLFGEETISRPTQSILQKWLREKYNIHIEIYIEKNNIVCKLTYSWEVFKMFENDFRTLKEDKSIINYLTYEEALEAGLQEALKLI